ncbi:DUF3769 domain-containing protein [Coleofasciculus sp. FACHB-1120]|uniref:DUF3769 domain-containing protein n=1 Tax=Coleofasciculus sp. FACHB-1120 TaxID=2692783 RepID=UPI0016874C9C|nr:DUF3769 domain-containing protein [Coleofasciculus sp. FACHB-1120]MBD2743763.1 DUF3769 domain-containing protein [Coleofasciculus sp. FACHB-1120]
MPQPVPPPPPPAIINTLPPEDVTPLAVSAQTIASDSQRTLQPETLAAPTQPETFAPESSSSLSVISIPTRKAAPLGAPISVGHPIVRNGSGREEASVQTDQNDDDPALSAQRLRPYAYPDQDFPNVAEFDASSVENQESEPREENAESQAAIAKERAATPMLQKHLPSVEQQPPEPSESPESPESLPSETPIEPTPPAPLSEGEPWPEEELAPAPASAPAPPTPENQPAPAPAPGTTPPPPTTSGGTGGVVELTSDQQEYDVDRQVVTAEGDVVLRYQGAVVDADRLQVNLPNRVVVGDGNVAMTRGEQVLRGDRVEYYFAQDSGFLLNASGEIYQPSAGADFSSPLPNDASAAAASVRPLSDRITANQPVSNVTSPGGYGLVVGASQNIQNQQPFQEGGAINRLRFQADRVDFDSEGAFATNVRLTNDPFSPPELEVRADTARFRRISPLVDEITTTRSRVVFDQGFSIPIFQDRRVIDRSETEPGLVTFGYDAEDRGGVFAERTFQLISTNRVRLRVTPQYFLQKAVSEGSFVDPSVFGFRTRLDATLSPTTTLRGSAVFTSLDPEEIADDQLRASLRLRQIIGTRLPHTLNLEYSYRDRLFNGSLGYQTVQSSLGAVLTSPVIPLGNTGINLTYQAGAQFINADTDRLDLLEPGQTNNRVSLSRYQASASLNRNFLLWRGKALPATPTEGLRYTPVPVVPYVQLTTGVTGVYSGYSSGDSQESLSGNIGLQGQFGHFSRPFLDYTGFNVTYSQVARGGISPFLFDRLVDTSVLSAGITQQIYGPFRLGFQTSVNLNTSESISTDYFLEYSRRTYNVVLRYNPVLALGSISFRLNDFNWLGTPEPFPGSGVRPVVQGVSR